MRGRAADKRLCRLHTIRERLAVAKRCLSCGRVSYALAVRRKPSDIAAARVIDSRGVAGCRLAADDLAARIVGRRHVSVRRRAASRSAAAIAERRGVAVRRCAADTLATAVIVRGRVSVRDRAVGRSPNTVAERRGVAARRRASNALADAVVERSGR